MHLRQLPAQFTFRTVRGYDKSRYTESTSATAEADRCRTRSADWSRKPPPEEAYHWLFVASTFGSKKLLDDVIAGTTDRPDLREELLAGLLYDVMRRLVK